MVPPRSLKSHCASICLPAFILGHDPSRRILCASYSQDLASALALQCRKLMQSPWYLDTFAQTRLLAEKSAVDEFMTTRMGVRLATSVGGTLTGKGGDYIIIDDPTGCRGRLIPMLRASASMSGMATPCTRA
jgi:hypothetical protein